MPIKLPCLIVLLLFIGACIYFFYPVIESFFVFYPEPSFSWTPEEEGMEYKEVYFKTRDQKRLHGWYFKADDPGPVLLFCHGNAGNISHRLEVIRRFRSHGLAVFIFDYRGFGKSKGSPSEKGIYLDGLAAYDYLKNEENLPVDRIMPFGRSLGAAVAIEIALNRPVDSVIIESGFTSIREMASTIKLFRPFSFIIPEHYDNLEKIPSIRVPKLIIHGKMDELVPFSMGRKLFNAAQEEKFFLPLDDAGHNNTFVVGGQKYFNAIKAFAEKSAM